MTKQNFMNIHTNKPTVRVARETFTNLCNIL